MLWSGLPLFAPAALPLLSGDNDVKNLALKLANVFGNKKSAGVVGRAYLRSRLAESNISWLLEELLPANPEVYNSLQASSLTQLKLYLLERRREDFRHNQVVNVDGWILSITEARLCALATLVV